MQSRRFWGVISGMAAGALWGLVFLAPKVAPEASPMMLTAGRYLAYGLIAALLIAPRWRRVTAALDFKAWRALAWLSLAGNIIYFAFLVVSVHFAGVGASALIVGMVPIAVALWGLKDKDAPPLSRVAPPILVAALAVGLIGWQSLSQTGNAGHDGRETLVGLACGLAALLSWTAFAVGNSRWMGRLHNVSPHDWSLLTGVVTGGFAVLLAVPAVLTMGVWSGETWVRFLGVSVGVAVFASIIGNAFWNQASRLLPLTMLGQMIVSETLFAFLYGFLWAGRGPTVIEIVAMILMVVSVVWCVRAHRPAAVAAAEGDH